MQCAEYKHNVINILYKRIWFISALCSLISNWPAWCFPVIWKARVHVQPGSFCFLLQFTFKLQFNRSFLKVRTDSSTEFGSNAILVDRIWIESAAGSNSILIVQICTALDRVVDFNKRITAFTTGELAERVCRLATSKVGFGRCAHSEPDGTPASANHRCWCCKNYDS